MSCATTSNITKTESVECTGGEEEGFGWSQENNTVTITSIRYADDCKTLSDTSNISSLETFVRIAPSSPLQMGENGNVTFLSILLISLILCTLELIATLNVWMDQFSP